MRVTLADLPAIRRGPGPVDEVGPIPFLAIELPPNGATAELVDAVGSIAEAGGVLVGVAVDGPADPAVMELLTLTVGQTATDNPQAVQVVAVDAALVTLRTRIELNPAAATVLAAQLRTAHLLPVRAALSAESLAYSLLQAGPEHAKWLAGRSPRPPRPESPPVRIARKGTALEIVVDRAHHRNALSSAVRDRLLDALAIAASDPDLEIALRGEGPTFCSGGDLDEFGSLDDPVSAHLLRTTRSLGWALHQVRDRLTVHVHGSCVGAGVELPAFAGNVVAGPGTTFRLPELGMGLIPGAGGTVSLSRRIGRWRTAWLALSGEPIDAATALAWGLVDALV
jgi:hypothetical protein